MPSKVLINISILAGISNPANPFRGKELAELNQLPNAYLIVEGDEIAGFGAMKEYTGPLTGEHIYNAKGSLLLPAWCDSHTHLVFARSRENEFIDKINGLSYAEIAARGGGILNSAKALQETSEDRLFQLAWERLEEISRQGTGAVEIKSGYGLNVESELKMLRVIKKLRQRSKLLIKSSFLGAHAFPAEYKNNHEGYIKLIKEEMLPVIAAEKLADYIDVFCEKGFFSVEETEEICKAGMALGLQPKIHANQLNAIGAVEAAVKLNALSVDHLETMDASAIEALSNSNTIGTLLPGAAFFLNMQYPPARELIHKNAIVALASDYNPGSCPSGNMSLILSLASIKMKMLPAEAINAATINGAFAMEVNKIAGSIAIGKKANLIITKPVPSVDYLSYAYGSNHISRVMISGDWIN